jgi:hypothetical protein
MEGQNQSDENAYPSADERYNHREGRERIIELRL